MVDRFIKIENLGRAGPLARTYHFHLHTSHYFLLFLSRWTKNTPFWLWIFISHSEYGRGRDVTFTWLSDSLHKQQGTSRSKDSIMGWCMWWFDLCGLDLRSVTRTGPRSSSGSPTKILNLRSIRCTFCSSREKRENPGLYEDEKSKSGVHGPRSPRQSWKCDWITVSASANFQCDQGFSMRFRDFQCFFYRKNRHWSTDQCLPTLVLPVHVGFSFLLTDVIQFNPCTGFNQLMVHFENSEQVWVLGG